MPFVIDCSCKIDYEMILIGNYTCSRSINEKSHKTIIRLRLSDYGEYSLRLRLGDYSPVITSPSGNNC